MRISLDWGSLRSCLQYQLAVTQGQGSVLQSVLVIVITIRLCSKGGVAGRDVPGSGATSFGAALRGASKSICVGSSSEGAIVYANMRCECGCYMIA